MIAYVRGTLIERYEDRVVVEAGQLGYQIYVPLSVVEALPGNGTEVLLHTYFQVREDAMNLYGFLHPQDLEMFRQLIGVNGVGPKGALGILSVLRPDALRMAILSSDSKAISRAPGIGVKTAQRVILDLKDRVQSEDLLAGVTGEPGAGTELCGQAVREAVEALTALGYSNFESSKAVKKAAVDETMTVEELLKASLKYLAF